MPVYLPDFAAGAGDSATAFLDGLLPGMAEARAFAESAHRRRLAQEQADRQAAAFAGEVLGQFDQPLPQSVAPTRRGRAQQAQVAGPQPTAADLAAVAEELHQKHALLTEAQPGFDQSVDSLMREIDALNAAEGVPTMRPPTEGEQAMMTPHHQRPGTTWDSIADAVVQARQPASGAPGAGGLQSLLAQREFFPEEGREGDLQSAALLAPEVGGDEVEGGFGATVEGRRQVPGQEAPTMSAERRDTGLANPFADLTGAPPSILAPVPGFAVAAAMAQRGDRSLLEQLGPRDFSMGELKGKAGEIIEHKRKVIAKAMERMGEEDGPDLMVDAYRDFLSTTLVPEEERDEVAQRLAAIAQHDPMRARQFVDQYARMSQIQSKADAAREKARLDQETKRIESRQRTTVIKDPTEVGIKKRNQAFDEYNAITSQLEKLINERTARIKADKRARKGLRKGASAQDRLEYDAYVSNLVGDLDKRIESLDPQVMDSYSRYLLTLDDDDRIPKYAIRTVVRGDGTQVTGLVDKMIQGGRSKDEMVDAINLMLAQGNIRASDAAEAIREIQGVARGQ